MQPSLQGIVWRLAGVAALVVANGFFVAAELAIVTVRKTRIDQLIAEGSTRAKVVRRAITDPDRYIAATQLGITMASLGLGWIGEPSLASIVEPSFDFLPAHMATATAHSVSVAIAFTLITAVHIVFGELAPKWVALERAESTALWVVGPTELFMRVFWPFIRILHGLAQAVIRAVGLRGSARGTLAHSEEELKMLVTASQEAGVLEEHEEQMLHRVFGFADLTAGQVMTPRTELVALKADATLEAMLEAISRTGFARLPVYREDVDDVVGILHATDVVKAVASGTRDLRAAALARETVTVPETLRADDLLTALRRRGVREALVIDEYGGTAGLVTFDSLMEHIVGEMGGGTDGGSRIRVGADGSAEIDGLVLVGDVNQRFDLDIDEEVYTTVGGYVLGRVGRRARVGDTVDVGDRTMRVLAVDGLRVATVWLSTPAPPAPGEDEADH